MTVVSGTCKGVPLRPRVSLFRLLVSFVCTIVPWLLVRGAHPAAGWCKIRHRPLRAAQTGYEGYCKACYRQFFPERHQEKQTARKRKCPYCLHELELQSNGFCKACTRARSCQTCGEVNRASSAETCVACAPRRDEPGATRPRLALWCPTCSSEQERASGRCGACYKKALAFVCHHCSGKRCVLEQEHRCAEVSCRISFRLCDYCGLLLLGRRKLQCKTCWHSNGDLCVFCGAQKAQHNLNKFRSCDSCFSKFFCALCRMPPPNMDMLEVCYACDRLALWCGKHCSELELQSGLCREHFNEFSTRCQYCLADEKASASAASSSLSWIPCSSDGCARRVHACDDCVTRAPAKKLFCYPCWRSFGSLCLVCGEALAQKERRFLHCCRSCLTKQSVEVQYELVRAESHR